MAIISSSNQSSFDCAQMRGQPMGGEGVREAAQLQLALGKLLRQSLQLPFCGLYIVMAYCVPHLLCFPMASTRARPALAATARGSHACCVQLRRRRRRRRVVCYWNVVDFVIDFPVYVACIKCNCGIIELTIWQTISSTNKTIPPAVKQLPRPPSAPCMVCGTSWRTDCERPLKQSVLH